MSKKIFIFLISIISFYSLNSQTIFGKWANINSETGKIDGVIEVYKQHNKANAKVYDITDKAQNNLICSACKGKYYNKTIIGTDIIIGLEEDHKQWSNGKLIDIKKDKIYSCYVELINKDTLKVRAYIGVPFIGKTVYWTRTKANKY